MNRKTDRLDCVCACVCDFNLHRYQDQTMPVIDHYREKGMVKHIKTDVSIDEVFEKVSAIFKDE